MVVKVRSIISVGKTESIQTRNREFRGSRKPWKVLGQNTLCTFNPVMG